MANEGLHFKELLRGGKDPAQSGKQPQSINDYDASGRIIGTFESIAATPRHAERPPPPKEE